MRTLDEVIEWIEDPKMAYCVYKDDALHYLKEYRERLQNLQDMMDRYEINDRNYQEAVWNCEMVQLKYQQLLDDFNDNPALTWQELRQMEGKPVWVETTTSFRSGWYLVRDVFFEDTVYLTDIKRGEGVGRSMDYGKTWQAYRKERS